MSAIAERAIQKLKTFSEDKQQEVMDFIDFLEQKETQTKSEKTHRLQEIMRNLASQNAFSQIENPTQWQRELRQDNALPR